MVKTNTNFSAFKLFYDEFVYKQSSFMNSSIVSENIDKIRDLTLKLRKTPKYDIVHYNKVLDKCNKKIRDELNKIFTVNENLFEYYYFIYKTYNVESNDSVSDMPFVISCSFYDDYRLDNKTVQELESNPNIVPKYNSLEKKEIRNEAKNLTRFMYFIRLLRNGKNSKNYNILFKLVDNLVDMVPAFNESHYEYFNRIDVFVNEIVDEIPLVVKDAQESEDYEVICEVMQIAYRKKFDDWVKISKEIILEYLDDVFENIQKDSKLKSIVNGGNDISFETYLDIINDFVKEKEKYVVMYAQGKEILFGDCNGNDFIKFKNVLASSFFDKRYINTITLDSSAEECVLRAVELYRLADELNDQIFERVMFDASHSDSLRRNGDVRTAIITKIYDLYNPVYLLKVYDDVRKEFEKILLLKDFEFKRNYNSLLVDAKRKYDFHGPIPTMAFIKTKLIERKITFIIEHCITELKSRDILGDYDTRNYDLEVMVKDIDINDAITMYEKMKYKIACFNYDAMKVNDRSVIDADFERNIRLDAAQRFIVHYLMNKLGLNANTEQERCNIYNHICDDYLNENLIFTSCDIDLQEVRKVSKFNSARDKWKKNSKWNKICCSNNK